MRQLLIIVALVLALTGLAAGCGLGTQTDTDAPALIITSPTTDTVTGAVVFSVDANDTFGVASVRFSVDNSELFVDFEAPYTTVWQTGPTQQGPHNLKAEAFDAKGNSTTRSKVVIVVNSKQ